MQTVKEHTLTSLRAILMTLIMSVLLVEEVLDGRRQSRLLPAVKEMLIPLGVFQTARSRLAKIPSLPSLLV